MLIFSSVNVMCDTPCIEKQKNMHCIFLQKVGSVCFFHQGSEQLDKECLRRGYASRISNNNFCNIKICFFLYLSPVNKKCNVTYYNLRTKSKPYDVNFALCVFQVLLLRGLWKKFLISLSLMLN